MALNGNEDFEQQQQQQSISDNEPEDSLDIIQALNAALSFLCWINTDASIVEGFLKNHPEALLLEGTVVDEGARCIVEEHLFRCKCVGPTCNGNRKRILNLLDCGFELFQNLHMEDVLAQIDSHTAQKHEDVLDFPRNDSIGLNNDHQLSSSSFSSGPPPAASASVGTNSSSSSTTHSANTEAVWDNAYSSQLFSLARDLRTLQMQELVARNKVIEMNVEQSTFQLELDKVLDEGSRRKKRPPYCIPRRPKPLSFFSMCTHRRTYYNDDNFARRSVLEYQVGLAALKVASTKKEHKYLQQRIRHARRTQFALLKSMFAGCPRHLCIATER